MKDKNLPYIEAVCKNPTCNKPFKKRKKKRQGIARSLRPVQSRTCSPQCSREYTRAHTKNYMKEYHRRRKEEANK